MGTRRKKPSHPAGSTEPGHSPSLSRRDSESELPPFSSENPVDLLPPTITALTPRDGGGHQFVCYADSCSGVAGAPEEAAFARVNAILARLRPQPQFICFPGDEIIGLATDAETLRDQWRHWFEREMRWLDRDKIPLYHTTGNHTAYDSANTGPDR